MSKELEAPDCANWNMWVGPEIEGYTDLGEMTLFVRKASFDQIVDAIIKTKVWRIWFCDEFELDDKELETLIRVDESKTFVIGCTYKKYLTLSKFVKENFQIYIQLNDLILKEGDHIKVGSLFYEESFMIGRGKVSNPKLYSNDIKIL